MYSPKIDESLIPILYKLAKQKGRSMTKLVDELLRTALHAKGVLHAEGSINLTSKQKPDRSALSYAKLMSSRNR